MNGVEELETDSTLTAGTKPRTPHHRSPEWRREAWKEEALNDPQSLKVTRLTGPSSITVTGIATENRFKGDIGETSELH